MESYYIRGIRVFISQRGENAGRAIGNLRLDFGGECREFAEERDGEGEWTYLK